MSEDGTPHVTPVVYALDGEDVVIAIDYGTKKLENLRRNPKVSLVVDSREPNRGLMIQGVCKILERGPEYKRLLKILSNRFEYYRRNPWEEGVANSGCYTRKVVQMGAWMIRLVLKEAIRLF